MRFPKPLIKGEGYPGGERKPGIPNFVTRIVKEAILRAGENVGNEFVDEANAELLEKDAKATLKERDGLVSYLEFAARNYPVAFLALLGRVRS